MFKAFYPVNGKYPVRYARPSDVPSAEMSLQKRSQLCMAEEAIGYLADAFAAAIPDGEFSPAQIQSKSRKGMHERSFHLTISSRSAHDAQGLSGRSP